MKDNDNNLEKIKLGIFGDSAVGKTYFSRKYVNDINLESSLSTIGVEYLTINKVLSNGEKYTIYIYDTAGQEKYRSLSLNSLRYCDGVILMYDITNNESFNSISNWVNNMYDIKDDNFPFIIVGNKCDLKDQREVSEEEGLEIAEKYKTTFFEVSSREGINVEKSVDELLKLFISKNIKTKTIPKNKTIKLDIRTSIAPHKHRCCKK